MGKRRGMPLMPTVATAETGLPSWMNDWENLNTESRVEAAMSHLTSFPPLGRSCNYGSARVIKHYEV